MKKTKYNLEFVNEGKPFEVTDWTVEKHEKAIALAIEYTKDKKNISDTVKENWLKYAIIYQTLIEIDETVELESVAKYFIHPENLVEFFNAVYYAGKKDIYFRQEEKPPKKKNCTSKKSSKTSMR